MTSRIWRIARECEQPKKHLTNQVIQWSRFEKYSLIAILIITVFLYGVVAAMYWHAPLRELLGW